MSRCTVSSSKRALPADCAIPYGHERQRRSTRIGLQRANMTAKIRLIRAHPSTQVD